MKCRRTDYEDKSIVWRHCMRCGYRWLGWAIVYSELCSGCRRKDAEAVAQTIIDTAEVSHEAKE
ncbi:hypothetical protein VT84_13930 [Gemmata sp. SH-PL17]|nr:hypothetical protein VT84_13930 [Gemmata sp. SH-PL17]